MERRLAINADDGVVDDNISASWTAVHRMPPLPPDHPETGGGTPWTHNLQRDGSEGSDTSDDAASRMHGLHWDNYTAALTATVVSTVNFDEIASWSFSIAGVHSGTRAIPEPST